MILRTMVLTTVIFSSLPAQADCRSAFGQCRSQLVQGYHLRAKLCFDDYLQHCKQEQQAALAHELQVLSARLAERSPRRVPLAPDQSEKSLAATKNLPAASRARRHPLGKGPVFAPAFVEQSPFNICAEPFIDGREDQAELCFSQLAKLTEVPAQRVLAQSLARLSLDMHQARRRHIHQADRQIKSVLQRDDDNKVRQAISLGRSIGFVGMSGLYGGFVGSQLGAAQRDLAHLGAGLAAASASGLAVAALTLRTGLKAQDLTLIESAMFIGGLNGLLLDVDYSPMLYLGSPFQPGHLVGLTASLLPAAMGIAAAYLTDLPEAGVRMASSLSVWSAGLYCLTRLSLPDELRFLPPQIMPLGLGMAVTADLVYLAALSLSPFNSVPLDLVWAMDAGVVSGGLAAYALGSLWLANTRAHTASMAGGMLLGALAGYALGQIFRDQLVPKKFRDIEPLILSVEVPVIDARLHSFADASALASRPLDLSSASAPASSLAFGLRWHGDLVDLVLPGS